MFPLNGATVYEHVSHSGEVIQSKDSGMKVYVSVCVLARGVCMCVSVCEYVCE